MLAVLLAACGGDTQKPPEPVQALSQKAGGTSSQTATPPVSVSNVLSTEAATSRFLGKATFGATHLEISALTGTEVADWIRAEFDKPATGYLTPILEEMATLEEGQRVPTRRTGDLVFNAAIAGNDQLRQRVVLALSEIVVVSNAGQLGNFPEAMGFFMDILSDNAFGNYHDLIEEVTYSPAMGLYLTYLGNRKGDADTGRVPDENYARELLQLFTIGLTELNMDGTEVLGTDGQPIEIFDNSDITGLAKVFTGLSWNTDRFNNRRGSRTVLHEPMIIFADQHSPLEKSFLGTTISANTNGEQSLDMALDAIFEHSNVAPFLSRQLIQRLTASHPSPAYVQRVANSFEIGSYTMPDGSSMGSGLRGDMKAVIAAVLLDTEALLDPASAPSGAGKIREPIIRFVNWARAFGETSPRAQDERRLNNLSGTLGQHPFRSPSVFNFFRPGFLAPGTETGTAGLTAPELQIMNESSVMAYINFINEFIYDLAPNYDTAPEDGGINADYTAEIALADDGAALIDRLDLILTGNALAPETQTRIQAMFDEIPVRTGTDDEAADRLARVRVAISMVMTAPGYLVQK